MHLRIGRWHYTAIAVGAVLWTVARPVLATVVDSTVTVIPVMVLYTADTLSVYGGTSGVLGQIQNGFQYANAIFVRSGALAWHYPVYVGPAPSSLQVASTCSQMLFNAQTNSDITSLRAQYGAAEVVVAVDRLDIECTAQAPRSREEFLASGGYTVIQVGALHGSLFAHELGHQYGCQHDPVHTLQQTGDQMVWARGVVLADRRCDAMSQSCLNLSYLSGASVKLADGTMLGDATHDNVRAVNQDRALVAAYGTPPKDTATCVPDGKTLCLQRGRFKVTASWATADGLGDGGAVPLNDGSGTFWFFDPDNSEMLIKVLNGCGVDQAYWVFYAATTNQGFAVTVTDTLSGDIRVYSNTLGTAAPPVEDTSAFHSCP